MAILTDESRRLLEWYSWEHVGGAFWAHPDYPMQDFHFTDALALAREMSRKDLMRNA